MKTYYGTPVYNKTMELLYSCDASLEHKRLICETVASFNALHPNVDMTNIYENIYGLKAIEFDNLRDNVQGCFKRIDENIIDRNMEEFHKSGIIIMDKKFEENIPPREEAQYRLDFTHEVVHCMENGSSYNGIKKSNEFTSLNEVLTQYNAFLIREDIEGINPNTYYFTAMTKDNLPMKLTITEYGHGYSVINNYGKMLLNLDSDYFLSTSFNGIELNDGDLSDYIKNSYTKLANELQILSSERDSFKFIETNINACKTLNDMVFTLSVERGDWDSYIDSINCLQRDAPKFTLSGESYLPLAENMACSDILMWAKENSIQLTDLKTELSPTTRSEKIQDFANCCAILREYGISPTVDDINNMSYCKIIDDEESKYCIKLDNHIIKGSYYSVDGNPFYNTLYNNLSISDAVTPVAFFESDINKNLDTMNIFDIAKDIKKYGNGIAYTYVMAEESYCKAGICGMLDGYKMQNYANSEFINLTNSDISAAASIGRVEHFRRKYDDLYKNYEGTNESILSVAMKNGEYNYGINAFVLSSRDSVDENKFIYISSLPCRLDIEGISKINKTNVLCDIYNADSRVAAAIIDLQDIDINFSYMGKSLASMYCYDQSHYSIKKAITIDGCTVKNDIDSFKWFLDRGVNLEADVDCGLKTFKNFVTEYGTVEEFKQMLDMPNYSSQAGAGDLMLIAAMYSQESAVEKVSLLINKGLDINEENYNGATAAHIAVRNFVSNPSEKTSRILEEIINAGADMNLRWDGSSTAAELFAETLDINVVKFGLDLGIKLDDILTSRVLEGEYNIVERTNSETKIVYTFSQDELKELKDYANGNSLDKKDIEKCNEEKEKEKKTEVSNDFEFGL